ncbi:MAG TPA: polysaccharide deacetylase family protein [Halanaerobiales bacterium]|nr:polysaccharide deacetylase family protein [Halanaerobiales bacterium]
MFIKYKALNVINILILVTTIILAAQKAESSFGIILNFDDGYSGVYENAFPIMQEHNIPGVLFAVIRTIGSKNHLSLEEIKELKKAGWEIGSHTVNHSNLEMLTHNGLIQEIADSCKKLKEHGLLNEKYASFCTPMFKWNQDIKKIAAKNYQLIRSKKIFIVKNENSNSPVNTVHELPGVLLKIIVKETSLKKITAWINEAQEQNIPLILVFHNIAEGGNEYYFSPKKFTAFIELIQEYPVITFENLYNNYINILP